MTERALILAAKNGDRDAAGYLVNRYMPFACASTRFLYVPGLDDDDLDQERRLAILHALDTCDPDRPLAPLVYVAARRWLINLVKASQYDRRRANLTTVPLDALGSPDEIGSDPLALADTHTLGPEEHLLWREEVRRLARGLEQLSEMERRASAGIANGLTYAEIEGAGVSYPPGCGPKWVDNALQRVRKKLQDAA